MSASTSQTARGDITLMEQLGNCCLMNEEKEEIKGYLDFKVAQNEKGKGKI